MKAHYKTHDSRIVVEVTGEAAKDLFKGIAQVQEIFDAASACGVCNCEDLKFQYRLVDDFEFYELACKNVECRARLQFGQHKKGGTLFPKRQDDDGKWLPHAGWSRYVPPGQQTTSQPVPPQQRAPATSTAPAQTNGHSGAESVQKMWSAMSTQTGALSVFAELKRSLSRVLGDDAGERMYYTKLGVYKVAHANEFKRSQDARLCAKDLLDVIESADGHGVTEGGW